MLYLIGLGLNADGISKFGMSVLKRCKRVYLENYTVDFPYSFEELKHELDKKIILMNREDVEGMRILDEAKKMDVALLVYGSPLTATTHVSLLHEAHESGVRCKVIYNASIFDALGETGLQLYKFGKIASMPKWDEKKNFTPDSFLDIVKENDSINAHSLILIDIGLEFSEALKELEASAKNKKIKLNEIVVCQALGTKKSKIIYGKIRDLSEKRVSNPFCFVLPGKLHFVEKEILESFRV